jgi:exodeoxyribonuclease-3
MRLYSWNLNGIRSAARQGFLTWLGQTRPDVLCVQETRAAAEDVDLSLRRPLGYDGYWASGDRRGYGGVATFTRLPVASWLGGMGVERFDREGRVVVLDLGAFDLYNVYFPNGRSGPERLAYKLDFYDAFLAHIDARAAAGRPIVFCGDVNTAHRPIDLARPRANERASGFLPEERERLDRWEEHGWVDSFRYLHPTIREAYTWWSMRTQARQRKVGWRLDYFFVHRRLLHLVRGAGICPDVAGSDHCPIWLDLEV